MSLTTVLPYVQIVLALLLIGGILLQRSEVGLGSAFGADSFNTSGYARRGAERFLFQATIALGILFALSVFIALIF